MGQVLQPGFTCVFWVPSAGKGCDAKPRESIAARRLKSMGSVSGRSSRLIWLAWPCVDNDAFNLNGLSMAITCD